MEEPFPDLNLGRYWVSHVLLGRCYEQKGKLNEAVEEFEKARHIESSIPEVLAALGHGYAMSGRKAEAMQMIRDLQARSKKEFVPSFSIATVYLGLGMRKKRFSTSSRLTRKVPTT
jgi:tetratricopeptide (TPR) repeat protein